MSWEEGRGRIDAVAWFRILSNLCLPPVSLGFLLSLFFGVKMEAICCSETSTRRYNPVKTFSVRTVGDSTSSEYESQALPFKLSCSVPPKRQFSVQGYNMNNRSCEHFPLIWWYFHTQWRWCIADPPFKPKLQYNGYNSWKLLFFGMKYNFAGIYQRFGIACCFHFHCRTLP
jgi:hypothetical protein